MADDKGSQADARSLSPPVSQRTVSSVPYRSVSRVRATARFALFSDMGTIIAQIYSCRYKLIHFCYVETSDSVLDMDDLWIEAIEAATSEVDSMSGYDLKLAVFKMTFIPLLDGLLSTAEDVLPYATEASISAEVYSMLKGCLFCVDYLYADSDLLGDGGSTDLCSSGMDSPVRAMHGRSDTFETPTRDRELRDVMYEALDDRECHAQIDKIVSHRVVLEEFLRLCKLI
uniref:Uncharacterized protein TCIL3000_10_5050 n=1 Tax=Trypanosoma congolense (strain IL3000) TaxID=1068625 RepID=G0UWH5_TRYCI|nr:unnamed protein product [Trypanosoma congolense IL3000]